MRKSHKQIEELIEARTHDYIGGQASEAVYRASLKALGVSRTEIELMVQRFQCGDERRESFENRRLKASARFLEDYRNAVRGPHIRLVNLRKRTSVFEDVGDR